MIPQVAAAPPMASPPHETRLSRLAQATRSRVMVEAPDAPGRWLS